MPARTAKGRAALTQTLGFRQYIATAEANQLSYEERVDVFCRYLPYAMVFGETERWAKAFAASVPRGGRGHRRGCAPACWYFGPPAGTSARSGTRSLLRQSTGSALAAAPPRRAGASFSGGGFGGGGGGSWRTLKSKGATADEPPA